MIFSLASIFSSVFDTYTQIAKCFPLGNVTIPMSFTAAVRPSLFVSEVPVLWATSVFNGSCPFIRWTPVEVSTKVFLRKSQLVLDRISLL